MKVLWFANTPGNADEYYDTVLKGSGGWIKALDKELQLRVDLSIAFYHRRDERFKFHNTDYYSIAHNPGIFTRAYNRITGFVPDDADLNKYLAIIEAAKPDIIHIHGTENQFGCIIAHTSIPVVVSIQGNLTAILNKFFNGFEKSYLRISDRKFNSIKNLIAPWSFNVEYNQYRKIQKQEVKYLKQVKYIMGRTTWDRRITRILAPDSEYFHEDRILRDRFYEIQWRVHERDKIILHTTIGNSFFKGFETICEALHLLNNLGIDSVWNVAGVNHTDLIVKLTRKKLKNRYPVKGLNLLGMIDDNSLIDHLLNSDMYVMPSHIENNANNLCEAMILGLPCIATFVGGLGSLIANEENGILLQDGDPLALAGAVLEIINDPVLGVKLGNNARKTALVRHNKARIVDGLINSYQQILSKVSQQPYAFNHTE